MNTSIYIHKISASLIKIQRINYTNNVIDSLSRVIVNDSAYLGTPISV